MFENDGISREEFGERIKKVQTEMEKRKIDLLYLYGGPQPENLTYLTNYRPIGVDMPGCQNRNAVFLLTKEGDTTLIIDREWYLEWAKEESWVTDILADAQGDAMGLSYDILRKRKLIEGKIGIDTRSMPTMVYKEFMEKFNGYNIDQESYIVSKLRETKSKKEIELISKGLEILQKVHDAALAMGREGVREFDIAQEIRRTLMDQGAEYSTGHMVLAGRRSTIPLACPMATDYRLKKGDMVSIGIFCIYKKYAAGIDRNWVVGEPSKEQRKLADIEEMGLDRAISLVKPGIKASDFMKPVYSDYVEPLLREAGFRDYSIQGYVGHGSGLATSETPVLWKLDSSELKPGMVIDMEPGIYSKDPRIGGIRTAEFVLVTETGCKVLTKYPRRIGTLA